MIGELVCADALRDGGGVIVTRLDRSVADVNRWMLALKGPPERRFGRASAELLVREREKLSTALKGDDDAIRSALRSIAGMIKGMIDIGSDWQQSRPVEWDYLCETVRQAHVTEIAARAQRG